MRSPLPLMFGALILIVVAVPAFFNWLRKYDARVFDPEDS